MGDLSKLKIAVGQVEIVEGRPSRNEAAVDRMVDAALDAGADVLAVPNSLTDEANVRLIGLNDSRIDVADNVVLLDACGELYRIAVGRERDDCDFSIYADLEPFSVLEGGGRCMRNAVVLRPVGMRDAGKKVLAYDGGSVVVDKSGGALVRLRDDFAEDVHTFTFADAPHYPAPCRRKLLSALIATIRRFDEQALGGAAKWVIGLSGGLDSSVVAALLVAALGPERVVGYNMSTRFNTEVTKGNAASLARALGIVVRNGSIENIVVALGNELVGYGYAPNALGGVVLENAQARTRGNLLSTFSALEGGVVANNGNRVEAALGYATLYGDAIGALAPIGDLTKVQLFGLARDINDAFGYEVVPANLLPVETDDGYMWQTMPSAELSSGQRDPMKWFYHDWLIGELSGDGRDCAPTLDEAACSVMERYLEDRLLSTDVAKWVCFYGLDDPRTFAADLEWVVGCMRASAFKRIQAPPAIALANVRDLSVAGQVAPEPSTRYRVLLSRLAKL